MKEKQENKTKPFLVAADNPGSFLMLIIMRLLWNLLYIGGN